MPERAEISPIYPASSLPLFLLPWNLGKKGGNEGVTPLLSHLDVPLRECVLELT